MKQWTWLLPCWVWKYCFAQLTKERVLVDGRTRFIVRLDEEFALVYDPQPRRAMLEPIPDTRRLLNSPKHHKHHESKV